MAWGMGLIALLSVPSVFAAWFGHAELERYANMILKPAASDYEIVLDPGFRLLNYCYHLSGIGVIAFAVGFSRLAKDLVFKAAHPSLGQA